jgi:DNA helicase-2/ATP-dependent DNA helicase PcrA
VNLLTYHRAKGLEFDAVFLPRLLDRELPFRSGRRRSDEAEERRLLYVGITRARRHLFLTWPSNARTPRSPFLDELVPPGLARAPRATPERSAAALGGGTPTLDALKRWRLERSRADGVPAYVVFHDSTLAEIAERQPGTLASLARVRGVGPAKLDRYGDEVLTVVATGRRPVPSSR